MFLKFLILNQIFNDLQIYIYINRKKSNVNYKQYYVYATSGIYVYMIQWNN